MRAVTLGSRPHDGVLGATVFSPGLRRSLASLAILVALCVGAPAIMACGDDVRCPQGTTGDPCRPDGPVGTEPTPTGLSRPDATLADVTQVTDVNVELDGEAPLDDTISDTTHEPEDSDANAVDTLEEAGPDAGPDSEDDATEQADVAPDSASICPSPRHRNAVFMTTPNIHSPALATHGIAACCETPLHDLSDLSDSPASQQHHAVLSDVLGDHEVFRT